MGPVFALVIANIIWGAAPPIFKFAYENIPPFTLGFLRFSLATVILVPFLRGTAHIKISMKTWAMLVVGALLVSLHLALFFIGLEKTESINVSVIAAVGPIILYFASVTLIGEKKNSKILFGMILGLLGSLIVVFSPLLVRGGKLEVGQFEGNVLILLATLSDVASVLFLKRAMKQMSPVAVTAVIFAIAALIFYPFALNELQTWSYTQLDYRGVIGILFGAFLSSGLAYYLHDMGISKIKAEEVGIFGYISPLVTVAVAVPLLHEYPDTYFYMGATLVFIGILIAERKFHFHGRLVQ